jgi:hypothetical protein
MQRFTIKQVVLFAAAVAVLALGALAATSHGQSQGTQDPSSNGGAREWVAFDPLVGVPVRPQTLNMSRIVRLVNTSTARNAYTVTYERPGRPDRLTICTGALQAGEAKTCTSLGRASGGFVDGYLQVRASQPLLVGGYIDLPVLDYEQAGGNTPRLKFLNRGTVQRLQFDWQPGCPPKPGGGCPTGQSPGLVQP